METTKYKTYIMRPKRENITEISIVEYKEILSAKQNLVNILYIEDKFNLIMENYIELEHDLLKVTLDSVYSPEHMLDWSISVNKVHLINRRLINLLTTTRLYLDQVQHDLNMISHEQQGLADSIKELTHYEYDNVIGYRVMEALRNYVQHRGLPVHELQYSRDTVKNESSISPFIKLDTLENDGKFKKAVLTELKEYGKNKINIKNYISEYIESLFKILQFIRQELTKDVEKWEESINNAFLPHKEKYDEVKVIGIGEELTEGFLSHRLYLSTDFISRRKRLEQKNSNLYNITNKIVTSKADDLVLKRT